VSYGAFAKRIGCTRQSVHRFCADQRIPRPEVMAAISAATNGAVSISDFYDCPRTSAVEGGGAEAAGHGANVTPEAPVVSAKTDDSFA